ncbi:AlbA family DNA-binding domain-containing protein [Sphingobium sp. YR768]|uniref:AlbA family DNA-binding domain-containing protein n=1 Tax=Sphingobium sp. YR768 TaxID=1884365 RepID=UPI0015A4FE4F|nr:ATP-binding protein [Sphingobium sp. YR768]
MSEQKRLKTLSAATRTFLASGEGQLIDFKRVPEGIGADDLAAFANAPDGGTILVGVGEATVDGAQTGVILGCDVSDNAVLKLLNKAISCLPPVLIDIVIENLSDKPILRISVPSSPTKPHCSPKGVYCRRDGARNRALHPTELLRIFLDTEAQQFAQRFEAAAATISREIADLEESLERTIGNMSDQFGWAESNMDDTSHTIHTVLAYTKIISDETIDMSDRLRTMFRQDKRDDPVHDRELKKVIDELVAQITDDEDLSEAVLANHPLSYNLKGKSARELSPEEGQKALDEASQIIRDRADLKNYRAKCLLPEKCSQKVIEDIAAAATLYGSSACVAEDVAQAFRISFSTYKDAVVATAGIRKTPLKERVSIFETFQTIADPRIYKAQLNWLSLHPNHHNKGQLSKLVQKLLGARKGVPAFAVVHSDDAVAREVLQHFKFSPALLKEGALVDEKSKEQLFLHAET